MAEVNTPLAALLLLALAAQSPDDLYRLGIKLFSEGKLDAALPPLQRAIALRADYAPAWKALGVVYAAQTDYAMAAAPFRKACELDPKLEDACFYYGRTLYLLDRFEPALEVLGRALKADRQPGRIHRIMAMALEALGRAPEAEVAFQEAIRLDRNSGPNEDPRIDYGVFLFRQGRAEQSLAPLEATLARHPDSARAHIELGRALLALERLPEALPHLERAVALDARSARAHLLLGKLYLRLGRADAAEAHLRQGSRTVK